MDQSKERAEKYKSYKLFVDKILKNVISIWNVLDKYFSKKGNH